jgi:hypothetical protein
MTQQRGMKRAQKVMKRNQSKAREERKSNIKQAIYAFEKAMKEAQTEKTAEHDHQGHKHK